jgi:hypothetical protein
MSRKFESIDLMKLYSQGHFKTWNRMLATHLRNKDINGLSKVRYQIQGGMDDLAKKHLNTDEINVWYCRLIKSLEKTAKDILKMKYPLPGDNPLLSKRNQDTKEAAKELAFKRKRDQEFMKFIRDGSY